MHMFQAVSNLRVLRLQEIGREDFIGVGLPLDPHVVHEGCERFELPAAVAARREMVGMTRIQRFAVTTGQIEVLFGFYRVSLLTLAIRRNVVHVH
ncbi:MAG: hypothetical protein QM736_11290, partial [Vicinamibacterales bacterium]